MASGRSARPEPGLAVEEFSGDVQVTGMSRGLLDHVQHDPAHIRRFVLPGDTVPAARRADSGVTASTASELAHWSR